jgi:hypothetical protein
MEFIYLKDFGNGTEISYDFNSKRRVRKELRIRRDLGKWEGVGSSLVGTAQELKELR